MEPLLLIAPAVMLLIALSGFRISQEYERGVVFRLGRLRGVRGPGLYYIIPFIDWQKKVDLRTVTVAVDQQETITKDSVTVKVNAVLWFRAEDPARTIVAVADARSAVIQVALTSLRSTVGQHALDEILRDRDGINKELLRVVGAATHPWGVRVEAIEMKDVEIPEAMQRAMAREAEASREKRARIIKAEAEYEAAEKLSAAAKLIAEHPAALELRRMQMISEVGAEQNTTTIIMLPSDFVTLARAVGESLTAKT